MTIIPVILSGGAGTRMWPASRQVSPKQFADFLGGDTLYQATLRRVSSPNLYAPPQIVCNEAHRFISRHQALEAGIELGGMIVEPVARNTAAAIAAAAFLLRVDNPEAVLLVLPSDQVMDSPGPLHDAIATALPAARDGKLITFGVKPSRPDTGYGYIKAPRDHLASVPIPVECFVEKPDAAVAAGFLDEGDYLWNSGMFLFGVDAFLHELQRHTPEIYASVERATESAVTDLDFTRLDENALHDCPSKAVDYAVMEQSNRVMVMPLDGTGWSDVGNWRAFDEYFANSDERAWRGRADKVFAVDSTDNFIWSDDGRAVGLQGVDGLSVISTRDALLVCGNDHANDIKPLIERISAMAPELLASGTRIDRPWGWYESLAVAPSFAVKHLHIRPGHALSLQLHRHRSEHWIVIDGTATVTVDGHEFCLTPNQSTFIPAGATHRLANESDAILGIVEVQVGDPLDERDIVRMDDRYGRACD